MIAFKQSAQLQDYALRDFWIVANVNFFQSERLLARQVLRFAHLALRTTAKFADNYYV